MSSLFVSRLLSKPPLGARVNWGNALTRELKGCWIFNEGSGIAINDLCGIMDVGSVSGGANWQNDSEGSVLRLTAASSQYVSIPNNPSLNIANPLGFTAAIRFRLSVLRDFNGLLTYDDGTNLLFDSYVSAAGNMVDSISGTNPTIASGLVADKWYTAIISFTMGSGSTNASYKGYLNGAQVYSFGAASINAGITNVLKPWRFGNRNDNATLASIDIGSGMVWYRPITAEEAQEVSSNPYSFLAYTRRNFVVFLSSNVNLVFDEQLNLSEGLNPGRNDNYVTGDTLALAEDAAVQVPIIETLNELLNLTDAQSQILIGILGQLASDTLTLSDAIQLATAIGALVGDTLAITDAAALLLLNILENEISDSLLLSDGMLMQLLRVFIFGEQLNIVDTLELLNAIQLSLGDTIVLSDAALGTNPPVALTIISGDLLTLLDSPSTSTSDYIVSYLRHYLNDMPTPTS